MAKKNGVPVTLLKALKVFIKKSKTDENYGLRRLAADLAAAMNLKGMSHETARKLSAGIDAIRL